MLLLDGVRLEARRAAAARGGPLAALADSIAADLDVAMSRDIYVPREKALLSRAGGRCEDDGTQLEFDPYSPDEHRCPVCHRVYTGEFHHRWWVYWYQLWLAERGVHAALLHLLRGDARHGELARSIAHRYCEMYAGYPNRDNVLGPTRLFFSTYLESIWLLQLCVTADLLEAGGDRAAADDVRARIVRPSAVLIAQYDEGMSNRQVWNNAALMAAALLDGDRAGAARIIGAASGVEAHLAGGLLDDGTWYEGENYHLFAHRGLWYCVALAEANGLEIDPKLVARFDEGFAAPFATALPDFTLPSRKDSQYAISLRQPRFAELCELGLARRDDARLTGALAQLYSNDVPRGDTNRGRSTADVERNLPATSLTRADLGWRSLLFALPELPPPERTPPKSAHLTGQGISVFRRDGGEVYVALDWGQSGGGHGHPDRLNILFMQGATRWLDDLGTGSYVDRSLHWYRSTLAHNAPMFDGRSQDRVDGELLAHDERGGVGWTYAVVNNVVPGVRVTRAVIVTPDYFVDELRWTSDHDTSLFLPIHFDGVAQGTSETPDAALAGENGLEDGFDFLPLGYDVQLREGTSVEVVALRDGEKARLYLNTAGAEGLTRFDAPGQPVSETRPMYVLIQRGQHGIVQSVYAWSSRVKEVKFDGGKIDVSLGAERHVHFLTDEHWQVELTAGHAQSGIELTGWVLAEPARTEAELLDEMRAIRPGKMAGELPLGTSMSFELGRTHYRRSEQSWEEAGCPSARVEIVAVGYAIAVSVEVRTTGIVTVPADAVNPYDNEDPDINGHGVQLYFRTWFGKGGAWIVVPNEGAHSARSRTLGGWGSLDLHDVSCVRTKEGFRLDIRIALPPLPENFRTGRYPIMLDVLVNETVPGRERRRGQLVLSGGRGEFVYLRGDRHDPTSALLFDITGV
jgi:hypothetical protein